MDEFIERARALNRQASDDIDHGRLDAAKVGLNEAIRLAPELAAPHTNLSIVTTNLKNIDLANLQTVPVGAPIGVPAVWCKIMD